MWFNNRPLLACATLRKYRYDERRDGNDQVMSLPRELRDLIESGPMAHLSTVNADGSPQVSVIWIGLDGDDLVSGHMAWYAKLRNIERDPRVSRTFHGAPPGRPGLSGAAGVQSSWSRNLAYTLARQGR